MRRLVLLFTLACLAQLAFGQSEKFNHVKWTLTLPQTPAAAGATLLGRLDATVDPEWHMYSFTTPPGPIPLSIEVKDSPAIEKFTVFEPPPVRKFDPNFNGDTETYEGAQTFYVRMQLKKDLAAGPVTLTFVPRYQTCSGTSCIPPRTRTVTATLNIAAGSPAPAINIPAGYREVRDDDASAPPATGAAAPVQFGKPVAADTGLGGFLLLAFGFGIAAVFTPCVFPMIPITMSYFVGQGGGVRQAVTFCLGIMVLFSGLGLLVTALLGPAGVVELGANVWVNGFIALVFFVFGMSLLGAFEITIPSGVLTKLNNASGGGGFVGTLLMGLTFALASFACVGPFMGTLLAASVGAEKTRPVLGMVAFSGGLALPFFLLALFPGVLAKLPRSGEWLARVKTVMGFVVLAAMLKYLHNVDDVMQWGILTRERFLAAWIVLFAVAGFYLLGFVRLAGISKDHELGVPRLLIGLTLVAFGLSLVPGMYCQRLGEIETYLPPPDACPAQGGGAGDSAQLAWLENDLDGAFTRAKAENKRVLVDFTGDSCTNCKWMKANLFPRPEINSVLKNMVLVELYTDRTDEAAKKFQKLEEDQFQTVAIPFYVLYDSSRNVLATFADRTSDSATYLTFLNSKSVAAPAPKTASGALDWSPFHTLEGGELSPAGWKGKVVVLNYWATWCVPCRQEIPEFNRMHEEMASKGVEVVGISMDEEGASVVKPFLEKTPMRYTVGLGTGSPDNLPITIVLDRAGKIVQRFEGLAKPEEIRAAVVKAQAAG